MQHWSEMWLDTWKYNLELAKGVKENILACQPVSLAPDLQMPYIHFFVFNADSWMYLFHGYLHVFLHTLCEHLLTMLMQTIWWLESFIIWTSKTWLYEVIWERQNLQRGGGIDLTGVNTPLLGRASLGICCPTSTPNLQAGVRVLCTACVDGLYYPDSVLCLCDAGSFAEDRMGVSWEVILIDGLGKCWYFFFGTSNTDVLGRMCQEEVLWSPFPASPGGWPILFDDFVL